MVIRYGCTTDAKVMTSAIIYILLAPILFHFGVLNYIKNPHTTKLQSTLQLFWVYGALGLQCGPLLLFLTSTLHLSPQETPIEFFQIIISGVIYSIGWIITTLSIARYYT